MRSVLLRRNESLDRGEQVLEEPLQVQAKESLYSSVFDHLGPPGEKVPEKAIEQAEGMLSDFHVFVGARFSRCWNVSE